MRQSFKDLLKALEAEHERALAEAHSNTGESRRDFELPFVRSTLVPWDKDLGVAPYPVVECNEGASLKPHRFQEEHTLQPKTDATENPETQDALDTRVKTSSEELESPNDSRRSSSRGECDEGIKFEAWANHNVAVKVLEATSFLDGPCGFAKYKNPLGSQRPRQFHWCFLWVLYCVYSLYHAIRALVLLFVRQLDPDLRLAALVLFVWSSANAAVGIKAVWLGHLSAIRGFSAALSTLLSEQRGAQLLHELQSLIRVFHIRRVVFLAALVVIEFTLLFGPGYEKYRILALWPWPQTNPVAITQAFATSIYATIFFAPDVGGMCNLVVKHAVRSMRHHLEKTPVQIVYEEYDFFCDHLEDAFKEVESSYQCGFVPLCLLTVLLVTAFVSHPQSDYLAFFLYIAVFFVSVALKDTLTFADQNAGIASLADAVAKRPIHELCNSILLQEIHLRLRVEHRRPSLVVLGFFEVTRMNIFGLLSFLLSLVFVIIFEMRT